MQLRRLPVAPRRPSPSKSTNPVLNQGPFKAGFLVSQSRLTTSAPSPESRVARGSALDWERRYFIGSGRASLPHRPRTKRSANTAPSPAAEPYSEPVKNQRSQPRIPHRTRHSSGLGAPIFYRLRARVPATSPPHKVLRKHSAPFCCGASQNRLTTSAPSPEISRPLPHAFVSGFVSFSTSSFASCVSSWSWPSTFCRPA